MRRLVSSSSCSSSTPSAYVLPEPDCPHRKVWRSNPPASSEWTTPGARVSSPIGSSARAGADDSSQARTSSAVAARMTASWNGSAGPSSRTPSPTAWRTTTLLDMDVSPDQLRSPISVWAWVSERI